MYSAMHTYLVDAYTSTTRAYANDDDLGEFFITNGYDLGEFLSRMAMISANCLLGRHLGAAAHNGGERDRAVRTVHAPLSHPVAEARRGRMGPDRQRHCAGRYLDDDDGGGGDDDGYDDDDGDADDDDDGGGDDDECDDR